LLPYLYYYMWSVLWLRFYCTSHSKVHASSMSTPCIHYVVAMQLTCSFVVATTRLMSNSNTTSKSQRRISSEEQELCNSQENSTGNHNSILLTIYTKYPWSMLQLCICCASYPNVHALFSCSLLIFLMSYYSSTICLPQGQYVVYMCPDIIL